MFKNTISFPTFIDRIKSGTESVLQELNLNEDSLATVPYSKILENPGDVAIGVNKVQIKYHLSVFGVFDALVVKHFIDGQVMIILHTTTVDHTRILQMAQILFDKLGLGIYDSDENFSFKEQDRVIELARDKQSVTQSIANVWQTEKYSIVLKYSIEPLHQFALFITRKVEKPIDRSIRRDVIADLLTIDLNKILIGNELSTSKLLTETGDLNCIDYTFALPDPQLKVFDIVTIRLFSSERRFTTDIQTHVTLHGSHQPSLKDIMEVCNKIIKMYGSDAGGSGELDIHEVEMLEHGKFWTGRNWYLNEIHGLYNTEDDHEKHIYDVNISNDPDDKGFTLFIWCYNSMIEYFTAAE